MQKNVSFGRSNKVSKLTQSLLKSAAEVQKAAMIKSASTEPKEEIKKIALDEASAFIKSATNHGLGVYESDGNVWCIEKDAEGKAWLVRNDELTEENALVDEIVKSASTGENKSFFS
jgi:hypothetical protein